jgi:hypothetical protein
MEKQPGEPQRVIYRPKDLLEIGVTNVKVHMFANPKKDTDIKLLIKRVYARNADRESLADFQYLLINPQIEDEVEPQNPANCLKGKGFLKKMGISKRTKELFIKALPMKFQLMNALRRLHIGVHFEDFKQFEDIKKLEDQNNQLAIDLAYGEHSTECDISFSELKVVLIMPLVTFLYRFYVDVMVDMKKVESDVMKYVNGVQVGALQSA